MRKIALLLLSAGLLALTPTSALAGQPTREWLDNGDRWLQEGLCGSGVYLTILDSNEYLTTFSDGRQLITGKLFIRVTSVDTNLSTVLNTSGPALFGGDGSFAAVGRYLWWDDADGSMYISSGNHDYDGAGHGHQVAVCDMID